MSKGKKLVVERLKKKEYSKAYLREKEKRYEKPNHYPWSRIILIRDFFRTPDFYKSLFFFFSAQIMLLIIGVGVKNPEMAGFLNLLALIVGVSLVLLAIKEINKRQRLDSSRRKFSLAKMILRVGLVFVVVIALNLTLQLIGVQPQIQPNQAPLDSLYSSIPIATLFAIVIVSPVVEELVFRELLPYASGPSYISFILSSVLFIILHSPFGISGWINYAILSSVFLYARLKDNNVYSSIGVHVTWNLITVLV